MNPLLFLALLLLSSCAWLNRSAPPPPSKPMSYPLQTPGSYGGTFFGQHLLEGAYAGRRIQLQTYVEIDADQMVIVGLTPWQTRAFTIRYDGQQLNFENFTHRKMPFPPSLILSDVQQVLWPRLPNTAPWHVEDDLHPRQRRVYFRHQLITRIQYAGPPASPHTVTLRSVRYGYELHIRILPLGAGS
jgi:hypothetical protein